MSDPSHRFKRSSVSRAVLLDFLQHGGSDSLDGMAFSAGFVRSKSEEAKSKSTGMPLNAPDSIGVTSQTSPVPFVQRMESVHFWAMNKFEREEHPEIHHQEPDFSRNVVRFKLDGSDCSADPLKISPKAPELIPWSRLWPFLYRIMGASKDSRRPDMRKIIRWMAQNKVFRRIPFRKRRMWASRAAVLIDLNIRLMPFRYDAWIMVKKIEKFRGRSGLKILTSNDGPWGKAISWSPVWHPVHILNELSEINTMLVISDLGIYGDQILENAWNEFAGKLNRRGCKLTALAPCPSRVLQAGGLDNWKLSEWDRGVKPSLKCMRSQPQCDMDIKKQDPGDAELLLTMLAPAIRVEPALLRKIRYLKPELDISAEAAVWNHDHVNQTLLGFSFKRDFVKEYRDRFKLLDAEFQSKIMEEIQAHHQHLSPSITAEELFNFSLIIGELNDSSETFFARAVKTMNCREYGNWDAMTAWVKRVTARIPEDVWTQSKPITACWIVANRDSILKGDMQLPEGIQLRDYAYFLGGSNEPINLVIIQRGRKIFFEPEEPRHRFGKSEGLSTGSPLGRILTSNRVLQYSFQSDGSHNRSLAVHGSASIPFPDSGNMEISSDWETVSLKTITKPSWAKRIGRDQTGLYADLQIESAVQRFRWICPGRFLMGSPADEPKRFDNEVQHEVTITQGYWLGDTACTQVLWQVVMGENPSEFKGENRPVETVSWKECRDFINALNQKVPGLGARLPFEAEWEYACRAGTKTPFSFGSNISPDQVNYDGNHPYKGGKKGKYREETVDVKSLPCNPWGLYEMHGNVWEWCEDWFGEYDVSQEIDPKGPSEGEDRVLRGGSWIDYARLARSAYRGRGVPGYRYSFTGFRLALPQFPEEWKEKGTGKVLESTGPIRTGGQDDRHEGSGGAFQRLRNKIFPKKQKK